MPCAHASVHYPEPLGPKYCTISTFTKGTSFCFMQFRYHYLNVKSLYYVSSLPKISTLYNIAIPILHSTQCNIIHNMHTCIVSESVDLCGDGAGLVQLLVCAKWFVCGEGVLYVVKVGRRWLWYFWFGLPVMYCTLLNSTPSLFLSLPPSLLSLPSSFS